MRFLGLFSCVILVSLLTIANGSNNGDSYYWVTGEHDSIPAWTLNSQGNGRYVGVSDPCVDSISGSNQALLRAWLLALIENGVNVQLLHENYENIKVDMAYDLSTSKINQIMKFSPIEKVGYYTMGRSHVTKFGERIIEILEVGNPESADYKLEYIPGVDNVKGEYIMLASENSVIIGNLHSNISIDCRINGVRTNITYQQNGTRETQNPMSTIGNDTIPMRNIGRYWYYDRKIAELETPKYSLKKGLWCAIYESLVYAIVNESSYAYTVKQVNQSYESKQLSLIRSVYSDEVTVMFNLAQIFNNSLEPVWSVREVQK